MLPAVRNTALMRGKTYIGIDFGTSTTVVSIVSYDEYDHKIHTKSLRLPQMLPDGTLYRSEIVPTVIAWLNGRILVGEGASQMKYQLKKGKNIWYSFKMELGEDLGAKYYDSELREVDPFRIKNPVDAARVFFAYLKYLIIKYCTENNISIDILYAVSIPASFEANQRKDLLDALMANDMKVSKQALIDEPNAAFISYAVSRAAEDRPMFISPDYNSKVLVFDFGGGTCDISILEIGQSANGFFSKNIAISKFTKLGGDDIDRYITYHYLMPRFLEANGKKKEQFRTNERKQIASALYKVAERLKILVNKTLATLASDFVIPDVKLSDSKTEIESEVEIITNKGTLKQNKFYLTNKELTETMAVFLKQGFGKTTRIKGEDEYNSIFSPIESAIKKSKTPKEEIDYVLLIGGSMKHLDILLKLHVKNFSHNKLRSECLGLLFHRLSQFLSAGSLHARIIDNFSGDSNLSADFFFFHHQNLVPGPGHIDGGGQTRRSAADNYYIIKLFHILSSENIALNLIPLNQADKIQTRFQCLRSGLPLGRANLIAVFGNKLRCLNASVKLVRISSHISGYHLVGDNPSFRIYDKAAPLRHSVSLNHYLKVSGKTSGRVCQHRIFNLFDCVRRIVPCLVYKMAVAGYAVNLAAGRLKLLIFICQVFQLRRANKGKIGRIKEKYRPFSHNIRFAHFPELPVRKGLHSKITDLFSY